MNQVTEQPIHRRLSNGIDLGILPTRRRSVVAIELRFLAGFAYEQADYLGTAHVLAETITKGTVHRDRRAFNDAFDEIGAGYSVSAARETLAFSCVCLPEFVEKALQLHAEMIREPALPEDACQVALDLTRQSLAAIDDDPLELTKKHLHQQAYGQPLNRHICGRPDCLDKITREVLLDHWQRHLRPERLLASVAGAVEPDRIADLFERLFPPSGPDQGTNGPPPPQSFAFRFVSGRSHHHKELEQEHIGICFPGAAAQDRDEAVERVAVGVLSGGMSSRLWQSVREEQGLVYWIAAWFDRPREGGMVHLGASCTPQKLAETFDRLVAEVNRLADDVTDAEIQRAINGILASTQTHGDTTRAKANRLVNDLFYLGKLIPLEEKLARIRAIGVEDVRRYLHDHPRDRLSIVTLGPGGTGVQSTGAQCIRA